MSNLKGKPQNLIEALYWLNKSLPAKTRKEIKETPEDKFLAVSHHGLGRMIRNEWGLWGDSDLKNWFEKQGLFHADDMSGTILTSYHRSLHEKPIKLEEQIKHYQDYWEKTEQKGATFSFEGEVL